MFGSIAASSARSVSFKSATAVSASSSAMVASSSNSRPFSSTAASLAQKTKTHKGTAKRWTVIAKGGLFKRTRSGKQHLNGMMSTTRLNNLSAPGFADAVTARKLKRLLPYFKR